MREFAVPGVVRGLKELLVCPCRELLTDPSEGEPKDDETSEEDPNCCPVAAPAPPMWFSDDIPLTCKTRFKSLSYVVHLLPYSYF